MSPEPSGRRLALALCAVSALLGGACAGKGAGCFSIRYEILGLPSGIGLAGLKF